MYQSKSQHRRESAAEKTQKAKVQLDIVKYEVVEGDIKFLSGPHSGKMVRSMWFFGPEERDYIVSHLWNLHDAKVMEIIRSLTCK